MNNILISGSNGFVGTNFVNYLSQFNYKISGLSRLSKQGKLVSADSFNWDELFRLKEFDFNTIIHLAGKAHDLKNTNNEESYFTVNTGLTKSLFDVFLESNAQNFIYFSSVKAVADEVGGILTEDVIPAPQTAYGKSKLRAEEYLLAQKLPQGKRLIILRPCMIHGPGNKGNFNLLYQFIKKRIPYPLGGFENKRSFLSIQNLYFIIHQLLINPSVPGGIYNIADDEPLSTNELIRLIGKENNIHPVSWRINRSLIKMLAKAGDKLKLPFNSEQLKKLTENYVVSNSKIKTALGIEFLPVSSREGVVFTLKSF